MHIDVYPMHMNAQISNNTFGFSLRFVMFVMFARDEISETFLVFFKSRCFFFMEVFPCSGGLFQLYFWDAGAVPLFVHGRNERLHLSAVFHEELLQ